MYSQDPSVRRGKRESQRQRKSDIGGKVRGTQGRRTCPAFELGATNKGHALSLDAGKGNKTGPPSEPPEETQPCLPLDSAQ